MPMAHDRSLRVVAWLEAAKGIVVLLAGSGLLSLLHRDLPGLVAKLIEHTHLNPASRYPQIFLDAASNTGDSQLLLLAGGAVLYSSVRFVEAYGLFLERSWSAVLAAISGAIYVPFEVLALLHRPSWHAAAMLVLNLVVVALMVRAYRGRHSREASSAT